MTKRKDKFSQELPLDLVASGPADLEETYIRYLYESGELADEPEFIRLRLDADRAFQMAEKTHRKYARRLEIAEKKGGEELEFLQDDIRIEAIQRFLTPEMRKEILNRLDELIFRLDQSGEMRKILMATAVQSALTSGFPWGACNLVVALFQRALDDSIPDDEDQQLIEDLVNIVGEGLTPQELLEKLEDPAFKREFEERLEANPALFDRMTTASDKLLDAFIEDIWRGRVVLNLFTADEITEFVEKFQERLGEEGIELKEEKSPKVPELLMETTDDYLKELLNPDRVQQIKTDLQRVSAEWFRIDHKYAVALGMEIDWLDEANPVKNPFILSNFVAQATRKSPRRRRRKKK